MIVSESIHVCPIVDSLDQKKWLLQNGQINWYSVNNTQEYNHFARVQQMLPMWNLVQSSLLIQFLHAFIQIIHHRCLTFQFVHQSFHLWLEKFQHHRHLSTKNTKFEKLIRLNTIVSMQVYGNSSKYIINYKVKPEEIQKLLRKLKTSSGLNMAFHCTALHVKFTLLPHSK